MSVGKQDVSTDVVACAIPGGQACVLVFVSRRNMQGNKVFYPRYASWNHAAEVLEAFMPQYYLAHEIPPELVVSHHLEDRRAH